MSVQSILVLVLSVLLLFQMFQLYKFQSRIDFIDQLGVEKGIDLEDMEGEEGDAEEVSLNALMFDFVSNLGEYEENKARYESNLALVQESMKSGAWADYGLTVENVDGTYAETSLNYSFKDTTLGVTMGELSLGYDGLLSVSTYNADLVLQDKSSALTTLSDLDAYFQTDLTLVRETVQKVLTARTELSTFLLSEPVQTLLASKGMSVGAETEAEAHYSVLILNSEQTSLAEFRVSKTSAGVAFETLVPAEIVTVTLADALSQEKVLALLESVDARTALQKKLDKTKAELAEIMQDQAFISTLNAVGLSFGPSVETETQIEYPILNAKGEVLRILILDKATGDVNVSLPDGNEVQSLSYATEMLESSSKKKLSTYLV